MKSVQTGVFLSRYFHVLNWIHKLNLKSEYANLITKLNTKFGHFSCGTSLREKRLYSEFFWSVFSRIRSEYRKILYIISIFSPNAGKYRPEKLRIQTILHAVLVNSFKTNFSFKIQLNSKHRIQLNYILARKSKNEGNFLKTYELVTVLPQIYWWVPIFS